MRTFVLVFSIGMHFAISSKTEVTLPEIFSSNMVQQQGNEIPV